MHPAVYLAFLISIGWTFNTAIAATLPFNHDGTLHASTSIPPSIAHADTPSCSPPSSCSLNESGLTTKRPDLGLLRCDVPNTSTVLLITTGSRPMWPIQLARLIIYTRRDIALKIHAGGGDSDRRLRIDEVPYVFEFGGVEFRVDPARTPDPRAVLLTWRLLDDTLDGLVRCVVDQGIYVDLQAILAKVEPWGGVENQGTLFLTRY
ncbi:MAG: hypothetical protein Q9185_003179 [Variospora sp. 1 TL-2023]